MMRLLKLFRRPPVSIPPISRTPAEQEQFDLDQAIKIVYLARMRVFTNNNHQSSPEFRFLCHVENHIAERQDELFDREFRPHEATEPVSLL